MRALRQSIAGITLLLLAAMATHAQPVAGGAGSSVGYIDYALPQSLMRLRYDAAYNNRRPNRAEFFYARGAPIGPGLPIPELSVDYQDATAYLEAAYSDRFSGFVEFPFRFLNPELNSNTAGYADMNLGGKWAFSRCDSHCYTFQCRLYIPTGDADRGLGTDHFSVEPALLLYEQLSDKLAVEGEFRYWIPIDGTSFAGDIIRYGIGCSYEVFRHGDWAFRPVAEFVGWTVLDGFATAVSPFRVATIEDASGDTIVNGKFGVRARYADVLDVYAGYGRPFTGDRWYENVWRLEVRIFY